MPQSAALRRIAALRRRTFAALCARDGAALRLHPNGPTVATFAALAAASLDTATRAQAILRRRRA